MEQQTDIDIIWPAARFCEETYAACLQETKDRQEIDRHVDCHEETRLQRRRPFPLVTVCGTLFCSNLKGSSCVSAEATGADC